MNPHSISYTSTPNAHLHVPIVAILILLCYWLKLRLFFYVSFG